MVFQLLVVLILYNMASCCENMFLHVAAMPIALKCMYHFPSFFCKFFDFCPSLNNNKF